MSILNRSTQSQAVFILLAGALLSRGPRGEAAVQESVTKTAWHVQYVSGPISVIKGKKHKIGPLPSGAPVYR